MRGVPRWRRLGNVANVEVLPEPIPIVNERETAMKEMMMSIGSAVLCVFATTVFGANAKSAGPSAEDKALEEMVENFYRSPDAGKAIAAIPYVTKMTKAKPSNAGPMAGFYFGAVSKTRDEKDAWLAAKTELGDGWLAGVIADALGGKTLGEICPDDLGEMSPGILDFFWGYFFATGERAAPRRVIRRGAFKFPEEASFDLTQKAAQWSALAIAKNHEIVRDELEAFIKDATEQELVAFFDGKVPDRAKSYLSADAVAKIAAAGKPKTFTLSYDGYAAARKGESTLVFPGKTIEELRGLDFKGRLGGKWVNGGAEKSAAGYNKEYVPGQFLRIQFQCEDEGDGKKYVKCVRAVFTDSPDGARAVCDYSGYVTLGYAKNALGYDFKDDANWEAVDSAEGEGYGLAAIEATGIIKEERKEMKEEPLLAGFSTDYDAALAKTKAGGRNLFVFFTGSDWCVWCKRLVKEVFSKEEFIDFATNEYECVAIDFPKDNTKQSKVERARNRELQEKFGVRGFPTVVIADANESILGTMGYVRGGAKKWIDALKKELRLKPLRERHLAAHMKEREAVLGFSKSNAIGTPDTLEKVKAVKIALREMIDKVDDLEKKLSAIEVPGELSEEKEEMLEEYKTWEKNLQGIIDTPDEELLARIKPEAREASSASESRDKHEDGGQEGFNAKLPFEGARSLLDETANSHLPFCEKLFVAPELEMAGGKFDEKQLRLALREWTLNDSPCIVNFPPKKQYLTNLAKPLWEAGCRTPLIAAIYLDNESKVGMKNKEKEAEFRKIWEMWKDDSRWTCASKVFFVSAWRGFAKTDEMKRLSIDLRKKFLASDEIVGQPLDRIRWVACKGLGEAKDLFKELREEGTSFDPWLEAAIMACWHIEEAWKERGGGAASTVTDEGWQGYAEEKKKSLEWLDKAYELRPDLVWPFAQGAKANYGNTAEAWKWYLRSAKIFKDNDQACSQFLWGLRPRWCGSTKEMLDFMTRFLVDDFLDTLVPAKMLGRISNDVFTEEGPAGKWRNYAEWAEDNIALVRHLSDAYMNGEVLKHPAISMATRARVEDVFMDAAWASGDMKLYDAWREAARKNGDAGNLGSILNHVWAYYSKGRDVLVDWVAKQPESERRDLLDALRVSYGAWRSKGMCDEHIDTREDYSLFEKTILSKMYSRGLTKANTTADEWFYLSTIAGYALGVMAMTPGGFDLAKVLPKSMWVSIDRGLENVEVDAELSIDGTETKGEAILYFDWGQTGKEGGYQRFGVLTVANKTDEKDNRFAILPWPKGETRKSVKVVFRGRDAEVYDNGALVYSRQLKPGIENVKHLGFTRAGDMSVKVEKLHFKATAKDR